MTLGVEEEVRGAEPEGALAGPLLRRVLAVMLVAAWVAWAVPWWMSTLHEVRSHEFVADVTAGRVIGFQAVSNVRDEPWRFATGVGAWTADGPGTDVDGRPEAHNADGLLYTVDGVRTRWLSEPPGPVADRDAFTALAESGARPFTAATAPPSRDWMALPAFAAFLVWVAGLSSVRTRWGTRPFWVLVGLVPAGLGLVAYAVAELWWRGSPMSVAAPRLRWWHGLLVAVGGGLAVAALRAALT